jgi:uncharacterized repeat protein (TIGR03803 family)
MALSQPDLRWQRLDPRAQHCARNLINRCLATILLPLILFGFLSSLGGQTLEILHSFQRFDGANPWAGLAEGSDGSFYGATAFGGPYDKGTAFRITRTGALSVLVCFDGTNGSLPYGTIIQGSDGNLYGTTGAGGEYGYGTVFRINAEGRLTTLVAFTSTNGSTPLGGLMQASDGNFYGTTTFGGPNNYGTVFKMTTNGALTTLATFDNHGNGGEPRPALTQGKDGLFYGTTWLGGPDNYGTVFRLAPNGELTTLVSFNNIMGGDPWAPVLQARNGDFYGTTYYGGANLCGTVFEVTTNGEFRTLVAFKYRNGHGTNPSGALVEDPDGNVYGTTYYGGISDRGTVFQITPAGILNTLVNFTNYNGAYPLGGLLQGKDGNLYGTTYEGGVGVGTIFRVVMPVSLKAQLIGNEFLISWATNLGLGYRLQSKGTVDPATTWVYCTNVPAIMGEKFIVRDRMSGSAGFYRLIKTIPGITQPSESFGFQVPQAATREPTEMRDHRRPQSIREIW